MQILNDVSQLDHQLSAKILWESSCSILISVLQFVEFNVVFQGETVYVIHDQVKGFSLLIDICFMHFYDVLVV